MTPLERFGRHTYRCRANTARNDEPDCNCGLTAAIEAQAPQPVAGLPKVGLHDLRHSCATILFSMGVPLPVISDILGHSTIRITADLYRHRIPALSVEAAAKMQEAIG